jgi:hypothetical protein
LVEGNGFLARVVMKGRTLIVEDGPGDFTAYGLNPGGVAGSGSDLGSAYVDFRTGCLSVLFDFAAEAENIERFHKLAENFFSNTAPELEAEWAEAVAEVRAGKVESDLSKVNSDSYKPSLAVSVVERPQAKSNQLEHQKLAA